MRTGGADRRSRIDILSEMRSAVGLSAYVVPVGMPIGPKSPEPPPNFKAIRAEPTPPCEAKTNQAMYRTRSFQLALQLRPGW